ncbi:MAG: DUF4982 domain-containing protein [Clostridia bacterium]|nr:DUF4982 domain-containing protein [Clostridia bacterium]
MKKTGFMTDWTCNGASVTLPHDAMIHEKRQADAPGGSGHAFFPGGIYQYEKTFTVEETQAGKPMLLHFEGAYRNTTVTVNGEEAGSCAYGYIPFTADITKLVHAGENTVSVRVDNSQLPNSRWYCGSGIYRPVWLLTAEEDHIAFEGVKVDTVSVEPAKIRVRTEIAGSGDIAVEIRNAQGKTVAEGQGSDITLEIRNAQLWSAETPVLYTARVTLKKGGKPVDEETISFGIRQITWSNKGLFINGQETLLRGGCIHHDSGILGAATYDESEYRRAKLLKEAGFNALRISHNPASRALLEACDKVGLYVMDETWDMWYNHKTLHDYATDFTANWKDDLTKLVNRDYNHPSVIMYSIGNEISEPATEKGVQLAKEMVALLHQLDPGRAATGGINLMIITRSAKGNAIYKEDGSGRADEKKQKNSSGMSSTMFNLMASMVGSGMNKAANGKKADEVTTPVLDALDIAGYNYASGRYRMEAKKHPNRIVVGSETFPQDIYKNWQMVKELPYLVGDFMWTAWDYLGECGIGAWSYTPDGRGFDKPYPWLLADTGAMDILGTPNAELFLAQCAWGLLDAPKIGVQPINHPGVKPAKSVWRGTNAVPSWSWQGCEGQKAVIEVYSDAAAVALELNGKRTKKQKPKGGRTVFKLVYQPGTLTAVNYDEKGYAVSRSELKTAENPALAVCPEKKEAKPGEILYVPVNVQDKRGIVESNGDRKVTVTAEGGELLAFGSAAPRTEEAYDTGSFTTYYGRAIAVIRAEAGKQIVITATDGKQQAQAVISIKK